MQFIKTLIQNFFKSGKPTDWTCTSDALPSFKGGRSPLLKLILKDGTIVDGYCFTTYHVSSDKYYKYFMIVTDNQQISVETSCIIKWIFHDCYKHRTDSNIN
jgi:hypothetical protein